MLTQKIGWPIGDNRLYELEALDQDGKALSDPTKQPHNVGSWSLAWVVRLQDDSADPPLLEKRTTTGGISIIGVYDPSRALNTQRVVITILDTDTDTFEAGTYRHALKRMDPGLESTVLRGDVKLTKTASPAS